jgi:WD40 repeat protein
MCAKRRFLRLKLIIIGSILIGHVTLLPLKTAAQDNQTGRIVGVAWSPDGKKVASANFGEGVVNIWSLETNQIMFALQGHTGSVYAIAWSPDGSKLATGSYDDMTIRVWDVVSGRLLRVLHNDEEHITGLIWSSDGTKLLSGVWEGPKTLQVWDESNEKLLGAYQVGSIGRMVWSPDGSKLAFANPAGVGILDGATFKLLSMFDVTKMGGVYTVSSVAWSPDGSKLASGSVDGTVRLWSAQTGQVLDTFRGNDSQTAKSEVSSIHSVVFNSGGRELSSVSADGTVRKWDVTTRQILGDIQVKNHPPAYASAWSPYGSRLILSGLVGSAAAPKVQRVGNGVLQIIVPFPSLDELQALSKRCTTQSDVQQRLTSRIDPTKLPDFISEVKKLPKEQMPPACAADLIAVAEALQRQP